jgi:hypothetical protein
MTSLRLQSAMEYLMTYGWAILIIAVVLAVLFSLGIFGGGNLLGTSCLGSPGYSCQSPLLNSAGFLSFTLGQSTGSTLYNVQLACASTAASSGLPYDANSLTNPFQGVNAVSGTAIPAVITGLLTLSSGQTSQVSNVVCYNAAGSPIDVSPNDALGTSFSGTLYVNYTTGSSPPSAASNPWQTAKLATLTIKVT